MHDPQFAKTTDLAEFLQVASPPLSQGNKNRCLESKVIPETEAEGRCRVEASSLFEEV